MFSGIEANEVELDSGDSSIFRNSNERPSGFVWSEELLVEKRTAFGRREIEQLILSCRDVVKRERAGACWDDSLVQREALTAWGLRYENNLGKCAVSGTTPDCSLN